MALQELNYSFISDFDTFLRKDYQQRKNTAVKYLRCLKRVINVAIANRYLKFDPFLNFKVQREVVDKVFLTEEELRAIINKDFPIKRLERVRDIFIFCCFTGLSYSDVKTLDKSHFETDEAGRTWIKKHRVKTGVLFRVLLLPIPKLILEKYKGGEHLLPVIDLSSTDAYLKEIADLCGINKRISFHTARHSISSFALKTNGLQNFNLRQVTIWKRAKFPYLSYSALLKRTLNFDCKSSENFQVSNTANDCKAKWCSEKTHTDIVATNTFGHSHTPVPRPHKSEWISWS